MTSYIFWWYFLRKEWQKKYDGYLSPSEWLSIQVTSHLEDSTFGNEIQLPLCRNIDAQVLENWLPYWMITSSLVFCISCISPHNFLQTALLQIDRLQRHLRHIQAYFMIITCRASNLLFRACIFLITSWETHC